MSHYWCIHGWAGFGVRQGIFSSRGLWYKNACRQIMEVWGFFCGDFWHEGVGFQGLSF
jgi:hypothetical protein